MTTLLAFFIVLNSLAQDQTGANLYSGTGSFVRALNSLGMQGTFSQRRDPHPIRQHATSPAYLPEGARDDPAGRQNKGPDTKDDQLRVIDREAEAFHRFINEMERFFPVQSEPGAGGEVVFDLFEPLTRNPPHLAAAHRKVLRQILPVVHRPQYRVQVIVWATTPSPTAWTRAARRAERIVEEIARIAQLDPDQAARLEGTGRAWIDSQAKRPVISLVVRKVDEG